MKRLLLIALVLCLVYPVAASFSTTFQEPSSWSAQVSEYSTGGTDCGNYIVESGNGGNSYYRVCASTGFGYYKAIINTNKEPTTYAAATILSVGYGDPIVKVYDSSSAVMSTFTVLTNKYGSGPYRLEIVVAGNVAQLYLNGRRISSSVVSQTPSYISFGMNSGAANPSYFFIDDFVYGSTENRYIFGMPKEQTFMLVKDMTNPAASGFAFYGNGTMVSSTNMTTTWGRGDSNESVTVSLRNYVSGDVIDQFTTTTGSMSGSKTWALETLFNNPNAAYGYYTTTVAGSGEYSVLIPYIGYGATVAFDKDTYVPGNTATATYSISDAPYFDPTTYSYRLDFMDVFATVVDTQPIVAQTGTGTYTFTSTDSQGVYYVAVIATPKAGGDDIWMGIDYAELTDYVVYAGYVNDAESATPITGANVSIAQGDVVYIELTPASGEYATNSTFYSGIATIFNITAAGYYQYNATFTPASAGTKTLNFTLQSKTPTFTGIALGGTCRDSVYGRPINYCVVTVTNATYGESYSVTANNAGYYLLDEGDGVYLTNGRWYSVAASKSGFSNSVTYLKSVWGA